MNDASLANVVVAAFPVAFAAVTLTLYRPLPRTAWPAPPGVRLPDVRAPHPPDARLELMFARLRCSTT
jgi:hypothetical protein